MSCNAVGVWLITDLKREKKQRRHVELARVEQFQHALGDAARVGKADALHGLHLECVEDHPAILALQLVAALAPDTENFHRFPSRSRVSMCTLASFTMLVLKAPHRPRSAGGNDQQMCLVTAVPASSFGAWGLPSTEPDSDAITSCIFSA